MTAREYFDKLQKQSFKFKEKKEDKEFFLSIVGFSIKEISKILYAKNNNFSNTSQDRF